MNFSLKKFFSTVFLNFSLYLVLIIVIQNSSKKSNVNFIGNKTVALPISFIIGTSFLSGSIAGSFLNPNFKKNN